MSYFSVDRQEEWELGSGLEGDLLNKKMGKDGETCDNVCSVRPERNGPFQGQAKRDDFQ